MSLNSNFLPGTLRQTGSGKTYTMGTGYRDDCQIGIIPQVMDALFDKIESFSQKVEFQLRVSFIEVCRLSLPFFYLCIKTSDVRFLGSF